MTAGRDAKTAVRGARGFSIAPELAKKQCKSTVRGCDSALPLVLD